MKVNGIEYSIIANEYEYNNDIFTEDSELIRLINRLDETDKVILLIYAELCSVRSVAKLLNVSKSTVHNKINDIKVKLNELSNNRINEYRKCIY